MIYRKNLPGWLEEFIYKDLGGSYEPDRNAFQNKAETLVQNLLAKLSKI